MTIGSLSLMKINFGQLIDLTLWQLMQPLCLQFLKALNTFLKRVFSKGDGNHFENSPSTSKYPGLYRVMSFDSMKTSFSNALPCLLAEMGQDGKDG